MAKPFGPAAGSSVESLEGPLTSRQWDQFQSQ